MEGYEILVDELEKNCSQEMIFAKREEMEEHYPFHLLLRHTERCFRAHSVFLNLRGVVVH